MSHKITPFLTYFFKYITNKFYLQGKNAWIEIVRKFIAIDINVEYNIHKSNEQCQTKGHIK